MKKSLQKHSRAKKKKKTEKEREVQERAHRTLGDYVIGGNALMIPVYTLQ